MKSEIDFIIITVSLNLTVYLNYLKFFYLNCKVRKKQGIVKIEILKFLNTTEKPGKRYR